MSDKRQRIHEILYSTDSREELAGRIVGLEDENATLRQLAIALDECPNTTCDDCV